MYLTKNIGEAPILQAWRPSSQSGIEYFILPYKSRGSANSIRNVNKSQICPSGEEYSSQEDRNKEKSSKAILNTLGGSQYKNKIVKHLLRYLRILYVNE